MKKVKIFWTEKTLISILIIALLFRIISALFSTGYGWHDDHYLVFEASQSWVDGVDWNNWLPQNQENPAPKGHSFFYVGIHYILLSIMKYIGIGDPNIKIMIIRLLHAFFSLLTVFFAYKITNKLANKKIAIIVGLSMAILWFMPFLSIRSLVEFVCVPFLFWGTWLLVDADERKRKILTYLLAGLIMGISFSVRFQTLIFIGGAGLALLFQKRWKESMIFGIGVFLSIFAIQGIVDIIIWKRPFAELEGYVLYNIKYRNDYGVNNWAMYISVILGLLVPPVSLFLLFGFFRTWKKHLLIFLPTFLFIIFHTYFPNKQERFIFSVIPFIFMLGVIGWIEFVDRSKFWAKNIMLLKIFYGFFIILNTALLLAITPASTKKSRIEAMHFLYGKNVKNILVEDDFHNRVNLLPEYYAGQWLNQYQLPNLDAALDTIDVSKPIKKEPFLTIIPSLDYYRGKSKSEYPQYVYFCDGKELQRRVAKIETVFPNLKQVAVIEPSIMDLLMYKLTKSNRNQTIYIYKTEY